MRQPDVVVEISGQTGNYVGVTKIRRGLVVETRDLRNKRRPTLRHWYRSEIAAPPILRHEVPCEDKDDVEPNVVIVIDGETELNVFVFNIKGGRIVVRLVISAGRNIPVRCVGLSAEEAVSLKITRGQILRPVSKSKKSGKK